MTKRTGSHAHSPDEISSKRHKTRNIAPDGPSKSELEVEAVSLGPVDESTQALLRIAEKADELIECLQSLKKQVSRTPSHTRPHHPPPSPLSETRTQASLSRICKHILPSVQLLVAALDDEHPSSDSRPLTTGENQAEDGDEEAGEASDDIIAQMSSNQGPPIPSSISVHPWSSSDLPRERPPLPEILDAGLAEEAFTHPGLGLRFSYERLEWLGDAYLELIATALIHATFVQLPSGRCSQLRERLVRNVNLAEYFRHYGMERWARLPGDFSDGRGPGRGKSCDKDLLKTQADMFEAYVAAAILADPRRGLARTVAWLRGLWGKTIEEDIRRAEHQGRTALTLRGPATTTATIVGNRTTTTTAAAAAAAAAATAPARSTTAATGTAAAASKEGDVSVGPAPATKSAMAPASSAKEQLARRIVVPGILLRYRDLPCEKKDKNLRLPLYSIGLYLDGWGEQGRLLGVGTALNKKEAGQKAAETMLQNRKLMRVYEEKKREYMEAREAVAQEGEAQEGEAQEGEGRQEQA